MGHPGPVRPDAAHRRGRGDRVVGCSARGRGASDGSGWACSSAGRGRAVVWLVIEITDGGSTWLATEYAWSGIVRLVLLARALALLLLRPPRDHAPPRSRPCSPSLTLAWGGHATGSPLTSLTLAIHLLAAVTWLGAAPAVALVMWDRSVTDDDACTTVRGFSRLATVALFVLIAGGAASGLLLTNGLEGGLTIYVWIVLAKVGVVGVAAFMGACGRRGLRHAGRPRSLPAAVPARRHAAGRGRVPVVGADPRRAARGTRRPRGTRRHLAPMQHDPGPARVDVRGRRSSPIPGRRARTRCWSRACRRASQGVTVELLHQYTGGSPISRAAGRRIRVAGSAPPCCRSRATGPSPRSCASTRSPRPAARCDITIAPDPGRTTRCARLDDRETPVERCPPDRGRRRR